MSSFFGEVLPKTPKPLVGSVVVLFGKLNADGVVDESLGGVVSPNVKGAGVANALGVGVLVVSVLGVLVPGMLVVLVVNGENDVEGNVDEEGNENAEIAGACAVVAGA